MADDVYLVVKQDEPWFIWCLKKEGEYLSARNAQTQTWRADPATLP
jgi:hypothetical protein